MKLKCSSYQPLTEQWTATFSLIALRILNFQLYLFYGDGWIEDNECASGSLRRYWRCRRIQVIRDNVCASATMICKKQEKIPCKLNHTCCNTFSVGARTTPTRKKNSTEKSAVYCIAYWSKVISKRYLRLGDLEWCLGCVVVWCGWSLSWCVKLSKLPRRESSTPTSCRSIYLQRYKQIS